MVSMAKSLLLLVAAGCGLSVLLTFSHTQHLLVHGGGKDTSIDPAFVAKLSEFPNAAVEMERKLLALEKSIQDFAVERRIVTAPSVAPLGMRWRHDQKCGKNTQPLPDGSPVECDPDGSTPCCSALGWCGNTRLHCVCKGCINWKEVKARAMSPSSGVAEAPHELTTQDPMQKAELVQDTTARPDTTSRPRLPPPPSKDGHKGSTVVVVIPFRDREGHLTLFKKYWRWFAENGTHPKKIFRWEIYVMEQFDSDTFNRGWNFNTGLAIASAQRSASPEIRPEMGLDFDCAVIQDIDYLPEKGVDYSECDVPIQLSAEIDRYNWKTPYLQSAGGIVGMSLKHWRKINGFGNNYFGWGGEDDELHHRLRLNKLLHGDCFPFCQGNNDKNIGKPGQSIKRPRKGFGRFSGKFMHSANHTKRITDSKAYARNIEQLKEIEKGGNRWKTDGLSDLAFHIVDQDTDSADKEKYGITYHHIRVRRGKSPFDIRSIPLAIPPGFCRNAGGVNEPSGWIVRKLGHGTIPWTLNDLQTRANSFAVAAGETACPAANSSIFLLIDRRLQLAKVFTDADPRLLVAFFRSLKDPSQDGIIVADSRPLEEILRAFQQNNAWTDPPTHYRACTSPLKNGGPKYSIHQGGHCGGGGWDPLTGGLWQGYAKERDQMQAFTWCDNEKHWIQIIVKGTKCPHKWAGLKWIAGGSLWARHGNNFCVGTRESSTEELSFSRILAKSDCGGDDFKHEFSFSGVTDDGQVSSLSVCIGVDGAGRKSRVSQSSDCILDGYAQIGQFAAITSVAAGENDKVYCVATTDDGDVIRDAGRCAGTEKFQFAVPLNRPQPEVSLVEPELRAQIRVCVGFPRGASKPRVGVGSECNNFRPVVLTVDPPSVFEIAASAPGIPGSSSASLFSIIEEEVPCFGFLCPVWRGES
eukprot:TRINITY_DN61662_c0_g1_i1.p1 TRINITY_DN61662_c0_g1~~TRINITY_DN61662_c0_g1_i1.p1  ORF type:complete len:936 (-),score=112.30 TRINITY_DN61662_c0_g1_i1:117-2873(-)